MCYIDSTQLFAADEDHINQGGPCDLDHADNYNTFCNGRDYDDPRGPERNVTGAVSWHEAEFGDRESPHGTWVVFDPGTRFTICTRPRADVHTVDGIYLRVWGSAERCATVTP